MTESEFPQKIFSLRGSEGGPERLEKEIARWRELRNELLEAVISQEEGVDMARVRQFIAETGLASACADAMVIDEEGFQTLKAICKKYHYLDRFFGQEMLGASLPELELCFVNRSKCGEETLGPYLTEGLLIHELSHTDTAYGDCILAGDKVVAPRGGLILNNEISSVRGAFLEEGFVEYLRGLYTDKYMPPDVKTRAAEKHLFLGSSGKYIFRTGQGMELPSTIAGFATEILCRKKPEYLQAVIAARRDVQALREIPKILNDIAPDLYVRLRDTEYSFDGFMKGLQLIMKGVLDR